MHKFKYLLIIGLLLSAFGTYAQSFSITDGNIATCTGTLFDSGGQGAGGYQNNENYTVTICPDNPNDVITLNFLNFALDGTNTATPPNNNQDYITIYDGDNTGATTLGTYTQNQLQGVIVTCTSLNTTGCITLTFVSNDQGTGVFAATISCSTPCQRPTAVATTNPDTIARICKGETVSFDGSGSFAATGFNIVDYHWDFDDGVIDSTSGPTTTYTFNDEGAYVVQLFVIDDNGCINSNLTDLSVWVAPDPTFDPLTADTNVCLGETANMQAFPSQYAQTWTAVPDGNLGGPQYVPDQVGQCFSTSLNFEAFSPGQQLNNINDLLDICIEFEHSFMGDLVISLYCPSGQSVILHQQGGGGTNLGDPDQQDGPQFPGSGWNYCWSPTATNGTWVDNSNAGATPNVVTNSSGSQSLAPGTYESLNPLSALVGCDLNGTWEIEFCDLWGADDGFVFSWAVNFDPSLFPPLTSFTPEIGPNSDSSFWVGPNITNTSADGNSITITPPAPGSYDYTYFVTDNHGCTNDTTITLTVDPDPVADAGPDTVVCSGAQIQLQGGVANTPPPLPPCVYTIDLVDTFGDGWNGASVDITVGGITSNYSMTTGSNASYTFTVNDGESVDVVFNSGTFDSECIYTITDCNGNQVFTDGPNPTVGNAFSGVYGSPVVYEYSWSPTTGLSNPNVADPTVTINGQTTYTVTVYPQGHPLCFTTDDVTITISNAAYAGEDSTMNYCQSDPAVDMFTLVAGTPDAGGNWVDGALNPVGNMFDPATQTSDVFAYVVGAAGCTDSAFVTINVADPFVLTVPNDTIICENGTGTLFINATGGFGAPYTETWTQGLTGNGPHTVNPTVSTCYDVYVTDNFGCVSDTQTTCINMNPPILVTVSGNDSICLGDNIDISATAVGGNGGAYNFVWDAGGAPAGNGDLITVSPTTATQYCVTVDDNCETTPVTECLTIDLYEQPVVQFSSDIVDGCYPITVTFTNDTDPNMVQSVLWDFGNGSTSTQPVPVQSDYTQPICYDVSLTVTSPDGCVSSLTQPSMICPFDYPDAQFDMSPNPTTFFETYIQFMDQSTSDVMQWNWNFGNETAPNTSIDQNPTATFPNGQPGSYPITLDVTNADGCTDSITHTLVVNSIFTLYLPNAFSPNNDGLNETFFAQGEAVSPDGFSLIVFDRDGHVIFEAEDINTAWDGRFTDGTEVPEGVYVWKVEAKDYYTDELHEYYGHVTVLK